jgi:hypothetical protein
MRTSNGYLNIEANSEAAVLIATELDGQLSSGSRSATVLLTYDGVCNMMAELDRVKNRLANHQAPLPTPAEAAEQSRTSWPLRYMASIWPAIGRGEGRADLLRLAHTPEK